MSNFEENQNNEYVPKPNERLFSIINTKGQENLLKSIPCSKINTNLVEEDLFDVKIEGYENTKGLSKFTLYRIDTNKKNWSVKRRYKDFLWLRNNLSKTYPGTVIPPLDGKKIFGNLKNEFVQKRKIFLQKFIDDLISINEIRLSKTFQEFLSIKDDDAFQNLKKNLDLLANPTLDKMLNSNGVIVLEISEEKNIFNNNALSFLEFSEPLYYDLKHLSKKLINGLKDLSLTTVMIGNIYSKLNKASLEFNNRINNGKTRLLDEIYGVLNNSFVSWSEQLHQESKIIYDRFYSFVRYEKKYNNSIRDILKLKQKSFNDYEKKKNEMDLKIDKILLNEKCFNNLDEKKIEIMKTSYPNEYENLENLKNMYGFYNFQSYSEIKRNLDLKCSEYLKNIREYVEYKKNDLKKNEKIINELELHLLLDDKLKEHYSYSILFKKEENEINNNEEEKN